MKFRGLISFFILIHRHSWLNAIIHNIFQIFSIKLVDFLLAYQPGQKWFPKGRVTWVHV